MTAKTNELQEIKINSESIKTLNDVEKYINLLNEKTNYSFYTIGQLITYAKENEMVHDVFEWARIKFGYKKSTVYAMMNVAKNFTANEVSKYGVAKCMEFKNENGLKYLESKGVTPDNTLFEIRQARDDSKTNEDSPYFKKPKNVTPKKTYKDTAKENNVSKGQLKATLKKIGTTYNFLLKRSIDDKDSMDAITNCMVVLARKMQEYQEQIEEIENSK